MIFKTDNLEGFGAYAVFPEQISVDSASKASFAVHEVGHTLYLDHSSEGNEDYGDDTCSMGYGLNTDDFKVCFNPPESWAWGWYDDQHVAPESGGGRRGGRAQLGRCCRVPGSRRRPESVCSDSAVSTTMVSIARWVSMPTKSNRWNNQVTLTSSRDSD
jgi:Gametolysin peptidase M11